MTLLKVKLAMYLFKLRPEYQSKKIKITEIFIV